MSSRAVKGGRRRLDSSVPPEYDVPTRAPRLESPRAARLVMAGMFVAWVLGVAGASTAIVAVDAPGWIERPSSALLMMVFAAGLTHRGGGHMRIWLSMAVMLALAAVTLETTVLLASAASVTAVTAAVWAVLLTRPAKTVLGSVAEYCFALIMALSGTVAVASWNAPVTYQRFNLIVITAALGLVIALVWNLGAGLHGLGRQQFAVLAGVALIVLVVMAYSSFVRTHGSETLVNLFSDLVIWCRQTFEGVPRPAEVLVGFPALIVGVSLRSRRREGWWVQVFAVIGTAVLTTSLVTPGAFPTYIGLSTLYSAVLGLIVGLVLRWQVLKRESPRASRAIEPVVRVEPPRFAPLK